MILTAQGEAFKQENVLAERLHGLDQQMERKGDESLYFMDEFRLYCRRVMDEGPLHQDTWYIGSVYKSQETRSDKVTPWKDVVRFRKKGKLAPRYVGPFKILERIGLVAYRLRLPEELNGVHDTFHVSNPKKCLQMQLRIVPLDEIKVDKTLRFVEEPVEIMDQEIKKLKRRKIALVKVRWNSKRGPEFTWEHEDQIRLKYP
ncbi:hypothetical protein Tco_1214723 [Tanacetum coccineum]